MSVSPPSPTWRQVFNLSVSPTSIPQVKNSWPRGKPLRSYPLTAHEIEDGSAADSLGSGRPFDDHDRLAEAGGNVLGSQVRPERDHAAFVICTTAGRDVLRGSRGAAVGTVGQYPVDTPVVTALLLSFSERQRYPASTFLAMSFRIVVCDSHITVRFDVSCPIRL